MNKLISIFTLLIALTFSSFADVKVQGIKGDVKVRHGVNEEWTAIKIGDVVNIEDAIMVGARSSTLLLIDGTKKITVIENSIVDVSDLRVLSQEELLLKLAMNRILSVPTQDRDNDLTPARTTIIHGDKKESTQRPQTISTDAAMMQLNGAKVLYDNSYFGTCILRVKEVFRINPTIDIDLDYKLLTAKAFEKSNLPGEALNEYNSIPVDKLKPHQKQLVLQSIERLKKKVTE